MSAPERFAAATVEALRRRVADTEPRVQHGDTWREPVETRPTWDPSTGRRLADWGVASPDDVDATVRFAHDAGRAWAALDLDERGARLLAAAELIEELTEEFALLDALDAGLPVERMLGDVRGALRAMRGWPGLAASFRGEVLPRRDTLHYTRHSPYGVVAKIVAYNHPFLFAVKGSLGALMAGNSVVLKPAEQTPLSALRVAEVLGEVLPPGVFSVLPGDRATGEALVTHPLVRRIAFTGSDVVGRAIQAAAARDAVRHVSLELGGKNPMVVFPDVDPEQAAGEVVKAMNLRANSGQSCGSMSRLVVHDDIAGAFVDRLRGHLEALTLGPATDPGVDMGPVISEQHRGRVHSFIEDAARDGAELVCGGLDDARVPAEGWFVAPTLFDGVQPGTRLAREEVFGPVMAVQRWRTVDEAVTVANDTDLGLSASVWSRDLPTALSVADRLEAGYVWVNDSTTHFWGMPFGGMKNSGLGREECLEEYQSYLQTKSVHVPLTP